MGEEKKKKSIFQIWAEKTTCHGISDLADNCSVKFRLFWSDLILAHLVLFGFCFFKLVHQFIHSPTTTTISTITKMQMEVPDVAICFEGLDFERMEQDGFSDDDIDEIADILKNGMPSVARPDSSKFLFEFLFELFAFPAGLKICGALYLVHAHY